MQLDLCITVPFGLCTHRLGHLRCDLEAYGERSGNASLQRPDRVLAGRVTE